MSIETNGHTATLTVATQAKADEGVPALLAVKESYVWAITGTPPDPLPTPPAWPWQRYPGEPITRRVIVVDGATERIDLWACGAIVQHRGDGQGDHVVCWDEGLVDKVVVRNCPADIADDLEIKCGYAEIEFDRE